MIVVFFSSPAVVIAAKVSRHFRSQSNTIKRFPAFDAGVECYLACYDWLIYTVSFFIGSLNLYVHYDWLESTSFAFAALTLTSDLPS